MAKKRVKCLKPPANSELAKSEASKRPHLSELFETTGAIRIGLQSANSAPVNGAGAREALSMYKAAETSEGVKPPAPVPDMEGVFLP